MDVGLCLRVNLTRRINLSVQSLKVRNAYLSMDATVSLQHTGRVKDERMYTLDLFHVNEQS